MAGQLQSPHLMQAQQQQANLVQGGGDWTQNAFQQPPTGTDRDNRVTLCFNDDISEVLNIMQQQQEVKPGERQEEEEEKRGEKEESEMKSGQVLTVFPPHLPLANLRSILLAQAGE